MLELVKDIMLGSAEEKGGGGGGGQAINNEDMTITSNGIYTASEGYTGIGMATVNVPAGSDQKYGATINNFLGDVDANGIMQKPISPINLSFNGVKSFGSNVLTGEQMSMTFYQNKNVGSVSFPDLEDMSLAAGLSSTFFYSSATSALFPKLKTVTASSAFGQSFWGSNVSEIDFSSLTTISGSSAFQNTFQSCKMTSVSFPELTSISNAKLQSCFNSCTNLTSVSFPKLTSVSYLDTTFAYCTSLTSVSFPELVSITSSALGMVSCFRGCSSLTSISFPKLSLCNGNCFQNTFMGCTSLTSVSFPSLTSTSFGNYTSIGVNMLQGVTGCTVHFPSNLQSVIGSWSDVTGGFGGTNTTVLYDLPATE